MHEQMFIDIDGKFDTAGMTSSMHYFYVYAFEYNCKNAEMRKQDPVLLIYYNEDTTIFDLTEQFKKLVVQYKDMKNLNFTLSRGYTFSRFKTMKNIKKDLRRSNIDGITFYIKKGQGQQEWQTQYQSNQNSEFDDQRGVVQAFMDAGEKIQINKTIHLTFVLLLSEPRIELSLGITYNDNYQTVIENLCKCISFEYQVNININDIQKLVIQKKKERIRKGQNKVSLSETLQNNSRILVYFTKGFSCKLVKKAPNTSYSIKIYDLQDSNERKVKDILFDDIKYKCFRDIYKEYFGKDAQTSHTKLYLKILNFIISAEENLEKVNLEQIHKSLIKNANYSVVPIFGEVMSEKMGFYKILKENSQQISFDKFFQEIEILNHRDLNMHVRDYYRNQMFKSKCLTEKIQVKIYESIYLFSSEIKVKKDRKTIYDIVNTFLRVQFNLEYPLESYLKNWKYRFIKTLYNAVNKLHVVKKTVYRGVNYLPLQRKGQIILFKQFLPTSQNIAVARGFAKRENKSRVGEKVRTIFVMQLSQDNGRDMQKYSLFPLQEEVLLIPFTKFLITDFRIQSEFGQNYNYFYLQQIHQQIQMQEIRTKMIVWIDDKPLENKPLYQERMQNHRLNKHPLIFTQLISTAQLATFLQEQRQALCHPYADVLFISDMERIEKGKIVKNAGIAGFREILRIDKFSQPHLIFFVNHIEGTEKAIKAADFQSSQLKNVNVLNDKEEFIKKIQHFFLNPINTTPEKSFSCQIY